MVLAYSPFQESVNIDQSVTHTSHKVHNTINDRRYELASLADGLFGSRDTILDLRSRIISLHCRGRTGFISLFSSCFLSFVVVVGHFLLIEISCFGGSLTGWIQGSYTRYSVVGYPESID